LLVFWLSPTRQNSAAAATPFVIRAAAETVWRENPPLFLYLFRISLLSFDPPLPAWKYLTACLPPGQIQDGRIIAKPARWALPDACGFSRYYMFN
jgi:hypothetical protein